MEYIQFIFDYGKYALILVVKKFIPRLQVSIETIFLLLQYKNYLKKDPTAIEIFGMHGLWHTKYYLPHIARIDIFEINKRYSRLSKIALGRKKVNYFCADSLKFIAETNNKYDLVVADTPAGGNFYKDNGLAFFWENLIRIAKPGGIIIFNVPTAFFSYEQGFVQTVRQNLFGRAMKDLFFIPKNSSISYCVLALE